MGITKKEIFLFLALLSFLFISIPAGSQIFKIITDVTYDHLAGGNYYISLYSDENGHIYEKTYYHKDINEEEIDFNNLILRKNPTPGYSISEDSVLDDTEIRLLFLKKGVATINNPFEASEDEIAAQESAKANNLGFWKEEELTPSIEGKKTGLTTRKISAFLYDLYHSYLNIRIFKTILYVLFSVIGIGTIFSILFAYYENKKINIIFMGDPNSGKTTIIKRIQNPFLSEAKVINEPPTPDGEIRKCDSVKRNGFNIFPYLLDNPGAQTGRMFDSLSSYVFRKKAAVIVIPFSKNSNEITRHVAKSIIIARILKQSKKYKKCKLILFINKVDLCFEDESQFLDSKNEIIKYFNLQDFQELTHHADKIILGSGLKNWNLDELLNEVTSV